MKDLYTLPDYLPKPFNDGACDHLREIDADGKRALTPKEAFILTWSSAFPGKLYYDKLDPSYSQKLLKSG